MSAFNNTIDESGMGNYGAAAGGYSAGFGGGGLMFIVIAIIFWLLFRNERGHDGNRDGDCCGVRGCCPAFFDESNYEEERNLDNKICAASKETNNLIFHESERNTDRYIAEKNAALVEKNAEILALKNQIYTDGKFGAVMAAIGKTDAEIAHLACEVPKRPPVFAECATPCATSIVTGYGGPRRGRCHDDEFA